MAIKQFKLSGFFSEVGVPLTGQKAIYDNRLLTATLTKETTDREVRGIVDGNEIAQLLDTYQTDETYTFATSTESIDSGLLALMFGEAWEDEASFDTVSTGRSTVPATGPYVVELSDISVSAIAADVQVTIAENGTWGRIRPLTVITTGSPTIEQVLLTAADQELTFAAGNAGAPFKYGFKKTYTNVQSLGVTTSPKKLDTLQFVGTLATTRGEDIVVVIKSMGASGGWELPVGDATSIDLTFKPKATGSNRSAVQFLRVLA